MSGDDHRDVETAQTFVGAKKRTDTGSLEIPSPMGPYEMGELLGRGGMAAVFKGRDVRSNRTVAVKVMDPAFASDSMFVERFEREAKASEGLVHPNVVQVLGHGDCRGWRYLAAEFIDGGTVANLLSAGALPPAVALEVFAQLMSGLAHAHAANVIHRDLKPENLLVTKEGVVKVADFGIARVGDKSALTRTGSIMGTAQYMSPEQTRGADLDARSDLFSTGVILYELLTGVTPFESDSPAAAMFRVAQGKYLPVSVRQPATPPFLMRVIERLLRVDVAGRFNSADEVLTQLEPALSETRRRNPVSLATYRAAPAQEKERHLHELAAGLTSDAKSRLSSPDPVERGIGAYRVSLALTVVPGFPPALQLFQSVQQAMNLNLAKPNNPRILEMEASLKSDPAEPMLHQRLGLAYKAEGNLVKTAAHLRAYLVLKPGDALASNSYQVVTGERSPAGSTGEIPMRLATRPYQRNATAPQAVPAAPTIIDTTKAATSGGGEGLPMRWVFAAGIAAVIGAGVWFMRPKPPVAQPLPIPEPPVAAALVPPTPTTMPPPTPSLDPVVGSPIQKVNDLERAQKELSNDLQQSIASTAIDALVDKLVFQRSQGNDEAVLEGADRFMLAHAKTPQAETVLFFRAEALLHLKRLSEAIDAYADFQTRFPTSSKRMQAMLREGESRLLNLDDTGGEELLTAVADQAKNTAVGQEALVLRGELRLRKGLHELARDDFTAATAKTGLTAALTKRAEAGLNSLKGTPTSVP